MSTISLCSLNSKVYILINSDQLNLNLAGHNLLIYFLKSYFDEFQLRSEAEYAAPARTPLHEGGGPRGPFAQGHNVQGLNIQANMFPLQIPTLRIYNKLQ